MGMAFSKTITLGTHTDGGVVIRSHSSPEAFFLSFFIFLLVFGFWFVMPPHS